MESYSSSLTPELEALQKLLHFPEEVAHRLTHSEYALFQSVAPMQYVRQITMDLSRTGAAAAAAGNSHKAPRVNELLRRFHQVLLKLRPSGTAQTLL